MSDCMGIRRRPWALTAVLMAFLTAVSFAPAWAQDAAPADAPAAAEAPAEAMAEAAAEEEAAAPLTIDELAFSIDNLFLVISAVLVIFMQAGFALVEVGFNSAKNAVNILSKNVVDFCAGVLLFYVVGYGIMYPGGDDLNPYFAFELPSFGQVDGVAVEERVGGTLHPQADFLFQAAFAATAATIVSGAVAGRMKFIGYLCYTVVITALIYPICGYWKWGGGWLDQMGFYDFAGSLVVHACGGFAGLAGAIVLGPRIGRYTPEGRSVPIPGSNLAFASLGVFILLIGWFGFNPGSQLAFAGYGNTEAYALIATNTTLAACAGGLASLILSWVMFGKPDLSMALNGILAGLVGITANCDCVSNHEAMLIGAIAGVIVLFAILALDKLKIDDPVGAFPVHGACGIWGGIATGLFGTEKDLGAQITGSIAIPVFAFVSMLIVFGILKAVGLLRVSKEEEIEGLDIHEHGMPCYGSDAA